MSKERPILFSAAMVRALLDGTKTQTRRIVNPQPDCDHTHLAHKPGKPTCVFGMKKGLFQIPCPYGQPGDRLWVRETFAPSFSDFVPSQPNRIRIDGSYPANGSLFTETLTEEESDKFHQWRKNTGNIPSLFMFRTLSRITLEIESIRVERLQGISERDAQAEGFGHSVDYTKGITYRSEFQSLWDSINGKQQPDKPDVSWDSNPWVWVVTFKRIGDQP